MLPKRVLVDDANKDSPTKRKRVDEEETMEDIQSQETTLLVDDNDNTVSSQMNLEDPIDVNEPKIGLLAHVPTESERDVIKKRVNGLLMEKICVKSFFMFHVKPQSIRAIKKTVQEMGVDMNFVFSIDKVAMGTYEVVCNKLAAENIMSLVKSYDIDCSWTFDRMVTLKHGSKLMKQRIKSNLILQLAKQCYWAHAKTNNWALQKFRKQQMRSFGKEIEELVSLKLREVYANPHLFFKSLENFENSVFVKTEADLANDELPIAVPFIDLTLEDESNTHEDALCSEVCDDTLFDFEVDEVFGNVS